jgi:hypothetical protein
LPKFGTGKGSSRITKVLGPAELDPTIQRLADRTGTKIINAEFADPLRQGAYYPKENAIYIRENPTNGRVTLIHELGHAKDFEGTESARKSWREAFKSTPQVERNRVVVDRFNRMVTKSDQVSTIAQVKRRLTDGYYKYISGEKEVFADGYGQFITNAKGMRDISPSLYKYFQSVRTI